MTRISFLIIVAVSILSCSQSDNTENFGIVYINDGAIQCEFEGLSETETAQILVDAGIDVIESQCGFLTGVSVVDQCGAGDITINLHTIPIQNLPDAQTMGFESIETLNNDADTGYAITDCDA